MSNKDKPFVMQHSVPAGVVATRWWWVRHAPVREDNGCCERRHQLRPGNAVVFEAVRKIHRATLVVTTRADPPPTTIGPQAFHLPG
jgi:hypothetical protein